MVEVLGYCCSKNLYNPVQAVLKNPKNLTPLCAPQWWSELQRHCAPGALRCVVYSGQARVWGQGPGRGEHFPYIALVSAVFYGYVSAILYGYNIGKTWEKCRPLLVSPWQGETRRPVNLDLGFKVLSIKYFLGGCNPRNRQPSTLTIAAPVWCRSF